MVIGVLVVVVVIGVDDFIVGGVVSDCDTVGGDDDGDTATLVDDFIVGGVVSDCDTAGVDDDGLVKVCAE